MLFSFYQLSVEGVSQGGFLRNNTRAETANAAKFVFSQLLIVALNLDTIPAVGCTSKCCGCSNKKDGYFPLLDATESD
jgi:hypothetical protein